MTLRVELRPTKGLAYEVECAAVLLGADNTLTAVFADGAKRLLARRDWEVGVADRWFDGEGQRLRRPLIHGAPDGDVLLHFAGQELADGKNAPWTLFGYKHVDTLNLARQGDRSTAPVFCTTMRNERGHGWIKRTTDPGVATIMLAPAGFSHEALAAVAATRGPRQRLSSLAG